jgi:predicted ATPase
MVPTALLFSRYRAFREDVRLDLAPLTVIIGKNGGGKSVITRLPLLLAGGLSPQAEAPLDLRAGGVSHAARFEDLIHQRSAYPFSLGAEISDGTRTLLFKSTLRLVVERHALALEEFELTENGQSLVHLTLGETDKIGDRSALFEVRKAGEPEIRLAPLELVGLFPVSIDGDQGVSATLVEARQAFWEAFSTSSYLGPFRSELGSLPRVPSQGVKELGPRGERTLDVLGDDALRQDGELVRAVENWFETAMGGNRAKLVVTGDLPRMMVYDAVRNLDVDIAETGAGFAQLLPVAVQAFSRRTNRFRSPLMIVEQPELHLHPAVHGVVADLIGETAMLCGESAKYVCETHSEQIISRIRRRVAEGVISHAAVKLISVGHQSHEGAQVEPLRVITLDESGNPDAWPAGVFEESFDDLVHLREAVRRKGSQAAE